jgi:peroxiredoxin/protein-disulfide isomerase
MILQPGVKAPHFRLRAVNASGEFGVGTYRDKKVVLVFFPSAFETELADQLAEYDRLVPEFKDQGASVLVVSDSPEEDLKGLARQKTINAPLLSDSNPRASVARAYGVLSADGAVLPSVFVIDEDGVIRRLYEASAYPNLPNPMMVRRFLVTLRDAPKAPPVAASDRSRGPADAPITLVECSDYECRHCIELDAALRVLFDRLAGKIRLVHRHLPFEETHRQARLAAEAAEAAGAQGKFWEMHHRLFEAGCALNRDGLIRYAGEIGLDVERFVQDLDAHRFSGVIDDHLSLARANRIRFPPSLFINGILYKGPRTDEALLAHIESLLRCVGDAP